MTAPRDKAREIVDGWGKGRVMSSANYDSLVAAIAAALIEARESALEEAIAIVSEGCDGDLDFAVYKLRALKGKP